jgi:hypothetical protein
MTDTSSVGLGEGVRLGNRVYDSNENIHLLVGGMNIIDTYSPTRGLSLLSSLRVSSTEYIAVSGQSRSNTDYTGSVTIGGGVQLGVGSEVSQAGGGGDRQIAGDAPDGLHSHLNGGTLGRTGVSGDRRANL